MQVFRANSDCDRQTIVTWRRRISFFYAGIVAACFVIMGLSWISNKDESQLASTTQLDEYRATQGTRVYAQPDINR